MCGKKAKRIEIETGEGRRAYVSPDPHPCDKPIYATKPIGDPHDELMALIHAARADGGDIAVGAGTPADAPTGGPAASRPVRPANQPIIASAAERILARQGDDGDGGWPRARRLTAVRKAVAERLGGVLPQPLADAGGVAAARMAGVADDVASAAGDAAARVADGDGGLDGSMARSVVGRLADVLRHVSDRAGDGTAGDAAQALSDALVWVDDGYLAAVRTHGREFAERCSESLGRGVSSAWGYLWREAVSRPVPSWVASMPPATVVDGSGPQAVTRAALAAQRVARGWDDRWVTAMSSYGLSHVADRLGSYARETVSWPDDYPTRPLLADGRDDAEWPGEQYWDLFAGIRGHDRQGAGKVVTRNEGGEERAYHTVKTNEEMGLGFAAWTQDCHVAADRLSAWADLMGGDPAATLVQDMARAGGEADRAEALAREAWEWLGEWVMEMSM